MGATLRAERGFFALALASVALAAPPVTPHSADVPLVCAERAAAGAPNVARYAGCQLRGARRSPDASLCLPFGAHAWQQCTTLANSFILKHAWRVRNTPVAVWVHVLAARRGKSDMRLPPPRGTLAPKLRADLGVCLTARVRERARLAG